MSVAPFRTWPYTALFFAVLLSGCTILEHRTTLQSANENHAWQELGREAGRSDRFVYYLDGKGAGQLADSVLSGSDEDVATLTAGQLSTRKHIRFAYNEPGWAIAVGPLYLPFFPIFYLPEAKPDYKEFRIRMKVPDSTFLTDAETIEFHTNRARLIPDRVWKMNNEGSFLFLMNPKNVDTLTISFSTNPKNAFYGVPSLVMCMSGELLLNHQWTH